MTHIMDRVRLNHLRRRLIIANWFMLGILLGALIVRIFG